MGLPVGGHLQYSLGRLRVSVTVIVEVDEILGLVVKAPRRQ